VRAKLRLATIDEYDAEAVILELLHLIEAAPRVVSSDGETGVKVISIGQDAKS
jgi:hypothetical protein